MQHCLTAMSIIMINSSYNRSLCSSLFFCSLEEPCPPAVALASVISFDSVLVLAIFNLGRNSCLLLVSRCFQHNVLRLPSPCLSCSLSRVSAHICAGAALPCCLAWCDRTSLRDFQFVVCCCTLDDIRRQTQDVWSSEIILQPFDFCPQFVSDAEG